MILRQCKEEECKWEDLVQGSLGKNKLHELRGVQFKKRFSAKFVKFFAKF